MPRRVTRRGHDLEVADPLTAEQPHVGHCRDRPPEAWQLALDDLLAGEDARVGVAHQHLDVAEPLLELVERAGVVAVAVRQRDAPDLATGVTSGRDQRVGPSPADRRVDEREAVVLAHETATPIDTTRLADVRAKRDDFFEDYFDYLAPSQFVPHLPQLEEIIRAAEQSSDGGALTFAQAASDLIHERFRYVKGATHVHSSIVDSLSVSAGICQDFAHVLLGVLRMAGMPARYVSGYLVPGSAAGPNAKQEEVIGGQASHAWAEVFSPDAGWVGLDPTLGNPVGLRHVRIAYGRDYDDVSPISGILLGGSEHSVTVGVDVLPVG